MKIPIITWNLKKVNKPLSINSSYPFIANVNIKLKAISSQVMERKAQVFFIGIILSNVLKHYKRFYEKRVKIIQYRGKRLNPERQGDGLQIHCQKVRFLLLLPLCENVRSLLIIRTRSDTESVSKHYSTINRVATCSE